jgi:hypothetical protein
MKGTAMGRVLERLLLWVADVLDRNLLTVPDLDHEWPPSTHRPATQPAEH